MKSVEGELLDWVHEENEMKRRIDELNFKFKTHEKFDEEMSPFCSSCGKEFMLYYFHYVERKKEKGKKEKKEKSIKRKEKDRKEEREEEEEEEEENYDEVS